MQGCRASRPEGTPVQGCASHRAWRTQVLRTGDESLPGREPDALGWDHRAMSRLVMIAAALLGLLLAGCADSGAGSDDVAKEPSSSASTAAADAPEPEPEPGSTVPATLDFTGTTVTGEAFEGASLAGRPTLLWFWAPWCPTCRGQIPQVEGIATDHAGELNVIGIGSLDSAEAIAGFAGDVDDVVHLEDVDGELWKRFGVTEQSSFVLLDADGTVVFEAGYGGTDDLDAQVDDVLG